MCSSDLSRYGPQVVCHRSFPKEDGEYVPFPTTIPGELVNCLKEQGIEKLYRHQLESYEIIQSGRNVLTATPTSSGKSLIYNLPVLQSILNYRSSTALYLFPLKALAQDQLRVLRSFEPLFEMQKDRESQDLAAIYDGDTSAWQKIGRAHV